MIQEQALVLGVHEGVASLEIIRNKPCGLCGQTRGCGISIWGRLFGHRTNIFKVKNTVEAKVDDVVIVGIQENALLFSALLVYGLPLLALLLGSTLTHIMFSNDLNGDKITALGGFLGLFFSCLWLKGHNQASGIGARYQPVILEISDKNLVIKTCQTSKKVKIKVKR